MFSGALWTCLCLLRCFYCYDFFFEVFLVNFKQILDLDLLLSVIRFVLSPEEATRGVLLKKRSLQLRNIYRKTSVLGSLFNKVVGLQTCNYIEKGLPTQVFPAKFARIWKHLFWKTSANGCFSNSFARMG